MSSKPDAELDPSLRQRKPAQLGDIEEQEIKGPPSESEWYYLNRSQQVGPFSQSELHLLLAKEVISSSTLVRTLDGAGWRPLRELSNEPVETHNPRSNWMFVALFMTPFLVGVLATVPKAVEQKNVLAPEMGKKNSRTTDDDRDPMAEATLPNSSIKDWTNSSPGSSAFIFNAVRPALPSEAIRVTRAALSPEEQSELEFWRSITHSNYTNLYMLYLQQYPSGPFADIAKTKIQSGKQKASVVRPKVPSAKRKRSSSPSRRVELKSTNRKTAKTVPAKTLGRCSTGNIASCRERCRAGDARACQKLNRIGG
jgi:hypothetical protein